MRGSFLFLLLALVATPATAKEKFTNDDAEVAVFEFTDKIVPLCKAFNAQNQQDLAPYIKDKMKAQPEVIFAAMIACDAYNKGFVDNMLEEKKK